LGFKNDDRYHPDYVVSHNSTEIKAIAVESVNLVYQHIQYHNVIAFDEAQFFEPDIVSVCVDLANKGKRVIVAGLDKDSFAKPFGSMNELMCTAEYVTKLHAICSVCGSIASFTFRKKPSKSLVLIGEKDIYEPRCRHCYYGANYNIF
ncbi:MAG: thymidine kinase, partial [Cytophagales bacterium]